MLYTFYMTFTSIQIIWKNIVLFQQQTVETCNTETKVSVWYSLMWGGSYQIIPRQWQTVSSNHTIKFYSETSSDSGFGKQNVTFFSIYKKRLHCYCANGKQAQPCCLLALVYGMRNIPVLLLTFLPLHVPLNNMSKHK